MLIKNFCKLLLVSFLKLPSFYIYSNDIDKIQLIKEIYNINKIELIDFNENISSIKEKKASFYILNFWASWCAPCRIEHPYLMKLSKEKNLKILGVNFKDKKINASKFLNELGNPYNDLAKDMTGKQSVNFGIYGIPESILVNNETMILKKFIGPLNNQDINYIKDIINSL